MPQGSVAYAVARVHSREQGALDASRIDRLLSAPTYAEALRALAELGWTGADSGTGTAGGADAEAIAAGHVQEVCALVRQITPSEAATDSFLLRYDGLNLKSLIKARCLGQAATRLTECGVYPLDLLRHAVADHTYKKLPDILRDALDGLEKTLAVQADALAIDTVIDKAIFEQIQLNMKQVKSPVIRGYFSARADMLNAILLLRVRRMGRGDAFMREMLLPGGMIPESDWQAAWSKPDLIGKLLSRYGREVADAAALAVSDPERLPLLEKEMDNARLRPFSKLKREALRIEPVAGTILAAEREASAVRLILAGKANGFTPEAVRERLRDLYGS